MLKNCHCKNEFQDAQYGPGIRVHTEGKKGGERCTVCGPKPEQYAKLDAHARLHNPAIHNKK